MRLLPLLALTLTILTFRVTAEYENVTLDSTNSLWSGLFRDCRVFPTMSCVKKNVYHYLEDTLDGRGDIHVGQFLRFVPNRVDFTKYTKEANEDIEEARADTPLGEVTDALSDKAVKFLMTHDAEFKVPFVLNDASLKISPRSFEGDGVLVKLDVMHPQEAESRMDSVKPRILTKLLGDIISKLRWNVV